MARQPEAIGKIQTAMILALVFPETLVIFTLVFLFLLKGAMPTDVNAVIEAIKAGAKYELLSTNPLGEPLMASPAISDGILFFRAEHTLFAVGTVAAK